MKDLAEKALDSFSQIDPREGFDVAKTLRNQATNHYSFADAKKNLKYVSEEADVNMYVPERQGNAYFPLGEAVMFQARLDRKFVSIQSKDEKLARFKDWLDWNLAANSWLETCQAEITNELIFKPFGDVRYKPKKYYGPLSLAGSQLDRLTPIQFTGPLEKK